MMQRILLCVLCLSLLGILSGCYVVADPYPYGGYYDPYPRYRVYTPRYRHHHRHHYQGYWG